MGMDKIEFKNELDRAKKYFGELAIDELIKGVEREETLARCLAITGERMNEVEIEEARDRAYLMRLLVFVSGVRS